MSRLKELTSKSRKYEIGGIEIEFKPFRLDELEKLQIDDKAPSMEQAKQSRLLIIEFLKKAVPDATDEELNSLSIEYMPRLMEILKEMHNIKDVPAR